LDDTKAALRARRLIQILSITLVALVGMVLAHMQHLLGLN
jgi:hypothetical protein